MLKLITGLPGAGKTSSTLDYFLFDESLKFRPKFATPLNGLDYDKHNVTLIDDLTDWQSLPDGSIVFVDEAQQYLRPRKKEAELPKWVAAFETHRHRGMDFFATTQNPMLIDVHFRRLVGEHVHYYRPFGSRRIAMRLWQRCIDDPNDFHALKEAQITHPKLPKRIFEEYKSTELDTHKFKMPKKLIFWGSVVGLLFGFSIYMGYPIFSRWFKVAQTAETPTAKQIKITNQPTQLSLNPTLLDQNHQIGDSENRPLTAADLQPVSPLAPWSAPLYRSSFHVESVPHFSGCISTPKKCSCYTQQGTSLDVDTKTCLSVIQQNNMPFNPMKKDSDDKPYQPQTEQEQVLARTQPIVIGGLNTEQQQQRTTSLNESWKNPRSQLNSRM